MGGEDLTALLFFRGRFFGFPPPDRFFDLAMEPRRPARWPKHPSRVCQCSTAT
jgi:hypothetical protein